MILLTPDALYSMKEAKKILGWDERTVRRAARRIGKKPYTKYLTGDDVRRMATHE